MDASTQTENISAISGILVLMRLLFIEESQEEENRINRELNFKYHKEMDERYEEDIYDSFLYDEDRIDILADKYTKNHDYQGKYTTHISMNNFHRGKSSNAKKKNKRSFVHTPDAHDIQEEQNSYYDVLFSGDHIIYF